MCVSVCELTVQSFMFLPAMVTLWIWTPIFRIFYSILVSSIALINAAGVFSDWISTTCFTPWPSWVLTVVPPVITTGFSYYLYHRPTDLVAFLLTSHQNYNVWLAYSVLPRMPQLLCLLFDFGYEIYEAFFIPFLSQASTWLTPLGVLSDWISTMCFVQVKSNCSLSNMRNNGEVCYLVFTIMRSWFNICWFHILFLCLFKLNQLDNNNPTCVLQVKGWECKSIFLTDRTKSPQSYTTTYRRFENWTGLSLY